jgi:arylformamidase
MWLAVYYYSRMPIYDLSVPLSSELPTYPGDPGIQISAWSTLDNGDAANVSTLNFGAHTGTHVDAPAHFLQGAKKVEALALDVLIGEVEVIRVPDDCLVIDEEFVVANCAPGTIRVLFKTRNSGLWTNKFETNFTYLELTAAEKLVNLGVKLVGIDYLSIEKFGSKDHEVHRALLSHEVIILEGINLTDVTPGKYELMCLPLRLHSKLGDGAPARAVLRTIN